MPISVDGNKYDLIKIYREFKIPYTSQTDDEWVTTKTGPSQVELLKRFAGTKTVPNTIGMTAKDAVYLLERTGMIVKIDGFGKVTEQSVKPGTMAYTGGIVEIKLK
jgi:cell division protein FtsI (penicillin-binding protein 3)